MDEVCGGAATAGWEGGSGVAHASFEPQASTLFILLKLDSGMVDCLGGEACFGACGGGAACERLKAE